MPATPTLALVHSRFRAADRSREMEKVIGAADAHPHGRIVVATQAVEAGVDISAAVLFTELAPWSSLVQRFGRANRYAELPEGADVRWIDLLPPAEGAAADKGAEELARPYEASELRAARERLATLTDVAPVHLPAPDDVEPPRRVIRRKDLDDLFDTDPDLTGFDVDVSPYVRDADDTDIRVFWRQPSQAEDDPPRPGRDELCAVSIGSAGTWIKSMEKLPNKGRNLLFQRDPQWRRRDGRAGAAPAGWMPLEGRPWPGLVLLAFPAAGGYREDSGFTGNPKDVPKPIPRLARRWRGGERFRRSGAPESQGRGDRTPTSQAGGGFARSGAARGRGSRRRPAERDRQGRAPGRPSPARRRRGRVAVRRPRRGPGRAGRRRARGALAPPARVGRQRRQPRLRCQLCGESWGSGRFRRRQPHWPRPLGLRIGVARHCPARRDARFDGPIQSGARRTQRNGRLRRLQPPERMGHRPRAGGNDGVRRRPDSSMGSDRRQPRRLPLHLRAHGRGGGQPVVGGLESAPWRVLDSPLDKAGHILRSGGHLRGRPPDGRGTHGSQRVGRGSFGRIGAARGIAGFERYSIIQPDSKMPYTRRRLSAGSTRRIDRAGTSSPTSIQVTG